MKTTSLVRLSLISAAVMLLSLSSAFASFLPPNSVLPPDIFGPNPAATLLASNTTGPVASTNGALNFSVTSAVYSDPTNTFGAGDLTFVYQVANSASSLDAIGRLTAINFTGFLTDVGYTPFGSAFFPGLFVDGTSSPQLVDRSLSGDTVGFGYNNIFPSSLLPGITSTALIIETNATAFAAGSFNVIDGGVSTVTAFEPTTPAVPDSGSTAILLGLSMISVFATRRIVGRRSVA